MPTNDFVPFAGATGANVETQANYLADIATANGVTSGTARSNIFNKAVRQATIIAAMVAQFTADHSGANSVDDGSTATLEANFLRALLTVAQPSLGFTPVQQGTGVGQLANAIKIGWSTATKPKMTVDATDLGNIAMEQWVSSGYQPIGNYQAAGNYLQLSGGTLTGSVTFNSGLRSAGNAQFDNAIFVTGNAVVGAMHTAGNVYTSNFVLTGPTDGNQTPCASAANGCSVSGGQVNAYNQAGSSGQFGTAAAGDIVDFWVGNVNTISIQGKITTGGTGVNYSTMSDYRLKENVVPLSGALERLAALTPKRFNFKANPAATVDGFIAHEVAAVVPEAVSGEKDGTAMQSLDTSRLVPLLTAAVLDLRLQVQRLEQRLA